MVSRGALVVVLGCVAGACAPTAPVGPEATPTPPAGQPLASLTDVAPPWQSPTPMCTGDTSVFASMWINGADCQTEPDIQVHRADENTWILRQSMCTNYEGNFLYLMFGTDKVLLEDTGAGGIAIAATVYGIIDQWLAEKGQASIELVVVNSHGHGDHTAGNGQFTGQPNTTVVGTSVTAVSSFFGIANWPTDIASYDLGGRQIDVVPIPGHQAAHIALYDHTNGWLLTGDTLYAGRLYISDFPAYQASLARLVGYADDKDVCWVLGTHIEMSNTPTVDFALGSTYHPDEHPLQLERAHLLELRDAVNAMAGNPQIEAHDEFIVYPL